MENTIENKAKFFAQYWGQKVVKDDQESKVLLEPRTVINSQSFDDSWLELTSLAEITDEESIDVAKMLEPEWKTPQIIYNDTKTTSVARQRPNYGHCIDFYSEGTIYSEKNYYSDEYLLVYDHLRSKGYALPWMGLSVEQQIEYGWVKLTNPQQ